MTLFLDSLRVVLTQASQGGVAQQIAFVEAANALSLDENVASSFPAVIEARRQAAASLQHLWNGATTRSPEAGDPGTPLIRWTRWQDAQDRSGVGILFQGPQKRILVLPGPDAPEAIRLSEPVGDERLEVLSDLETFYRRAEDPLRTGMEFFLGPAEAEAPKTIPPRRYFGGGHPRFKKVEIPVQGIQEIADGEGERIGEAYICAGGLSGTFSIPEIGFSAETSAGHLNYQEDGFYVARFRLPGRPPVTIMVGADGLGGADMGEMASSAALQGVHAAVVEAVAEGRIPLPHELFEAASEALKAQVRFHEKERGQTFAPEMSPDAVASIVVVAGHKALFASSGDFMTVHSGARGAGPLKALGYTHVDSFDERIVTQTVGRNSPRLGVATLEVGDVLTSGSDGFWRNLLGFFKRHASSMIRAETGSSHPEQNLFYNLHTVLWMTPAPLAASRLHMISATEHDERDFPNLLPVDPELDNLTVLVLRVQEDVPDPDFEIPSAYTALERVIDF